MTFETLLLLGAILVLLMFSAFFSGSETALTAASRARLHAMEKDGDSRAALVNRLIADQERLIGTILLGNNLVNILASALATSVFLTLFGQAGVAYATLAMTIMVVIFAEVLPKTYAIMYSDSLALRVAPVLRPLIIVFAPVARIVQHLVGGMLKTLGARPGDKPLSAHDELRGAIDLHHQEGEVVKHDRDMLGGILDLKDLDVADIMVHRTNMLTINADDPPQKILDEVVKSPYTRIPLWRGEPENIIGVLHAKDVLRARLKACDDGLADLDVTEIAADPWFVPDTTGLKTQLNAFLSRKSHFALVVDEYGEVMGLVTLEDILEEIVGEIADEHDIEVRGVRPLPSGSYNVDGSVAIRDLNRYLDWDLPDEEATTVAGLVIHEAQTIPEPGQRFTFHGYHFEVLRRQRNRITALRITPLKKPRSTGDGLPS